MSTPERKARRHFCFHTLPGITVGTFVAATGTDAVVSHFAGQKTLLTPLWELLETLPHITPESLTEKYGIQVFSPALKIKISAPELIDIIGQAAAKRLTAKNPNGHLCSWDIPRTSLLYSVLRELPPDFYQKPAQKPVFALWDSQDMSRRQFGEDDSFGGVCYQDPPIVVLIKRDLRTLKPIDYYASTRLIAHELSHFKTLDPSNYLNGKNVIVDAVLQIIGVPPPIAYDMPDGQLIEIFKNHLDIIPDGEGRGRHIYLKESAPLGSCIRPQELVANLGETYFIGKSCFISTFKDNLGRLPCEQLYDFYKKYIFANREYHLGRQT